MRVFHEELGWAADAFIPVYGVLFLFSVFRHARKTGKGAGLLKALELIAGLVIVYGLFFVDRAFGIWVAGGLDYSTHTAFSVCLVVLLWFSLPQARLPMTASLLVYFWLMWYLGYHTALDMLTTTLVVLPLVLLSRGWITGRYGRLALNKER